QRRQIVQHLDDLDHRGKQLVSRRGWNLIVEALKLTQRYAHDIEDFDVHRLIKKSRPVQARLDTEDLERARDSWSAHQRRLVVRARLALSLSGVQHRLTAIVTREREALEIGLKNGALRECDRVLEGLGQMLDVLPQGLAFAQGLNLHVDLKKAFDPAPLLESLIQECGGSTDDLPTKQDTTNHD